MKAIDSRARLGLLGMLLGLLVAGCGPKSDDYYDRGYVDGEKLGKTRRRMSYPYLPADAARWAEWERNLYLKGFRDGDSAQIAAEMEAQGIHFNPPPPAPTTQSMVGTSAGAYGPGSNRSPMPTVKTVTIPSSPMTTTRQP